MKEKNEQLDQLFEQLKTATDPDHITVIQEEIWTIWLTHSDEEVDSLMILGCDEMEIHDHALAIRTFSEMIKKDPEFAEGWNKRATVYYLRGCFKKSLDDIDEVLKLEKRHFGALSGQAAIYREIGDFKSSLHSLQKLKRLVPYQKGIDEQIDEVKCKMRGQQK